MYNNTKIFNTRTIFNIPILFLIFNRLDTTKQVFEVIRKTAPSRLYIASDGHRDNCEGEKERVEAIRKYVIESIDWACEVKTLFRERNMGCGLAPAEAITWLFNNEEMGIILEDDCLPSESFFPYCKELLEKYKNNERIFHIAGNNPLTYTEIPYSYYFTRIEHCWGWASWRRAWNYFTFDITDLDNFIAKKKINKMFTRNVDRKYWLDIFKMIEKHKKNDIWDYQWTYNILNSNGICINPAKNLITNIGFGQEATHTIENNLNFSGQKIFEINEIKHPEEIKLNTRLINRVNFIAFGTSTLSYYNQMLKIFLTKYNLRILFILYNFLIRILKTFKKDLSRNNSIIR